MKKENDPKLEFDRIEEDIRKNPEWESETIITHQIWMEIVMELNSHTGKKQEFWSSVMDEYRKKYPAYKPE